MGHGDARVVFVDENGRAGRSSTCTLQPPARRAAQDEPDRAERDEDNPAESRVPRAEQSERTLESLRAEQTYRDVNALPPSQRPLALARTELARAFDAVMHDHWLRGDSVTNVTVARACGVDEKQIRQWRSGEKTMPAAALVLLPHALFDEVMHEVGKLRGRSPKRATVLLREALRGLGDELVDVEPHDAQRVVNDAQRALLEVSVRLADRSDRGRK